MVVVVMYLSRWLRSAAPPWAFEQIDGKNSVDHFFTRIAALVPSSGDNWWLCLPGEMPSDTQNEFAIPLGTRTHVAEAASQASLLLSIPVADSEELTIVLYPQGSIFPSTEVLELMLSAHFREAADVTFHDNMPPGLAPRIVNRSALRKMLSLGLPNNVQADFLRVMNEAHQITGGAVSLFKVLRVQDIPDNLSPDRLPSRVRVIDLQTWAAARIALSVTQSGTIEEVYAFKRALIAQIPPHKIRPKPRHGRKTRIIFCTLATSFSGAEESLYHLATNLTVDRYECIVVVPTKSFLCQKLEASGVRCVVANIDLAGVGPWQMDFFVRLLHDEQPDLVHIDSFPISPLVALCYAAEIPVVTHIRKFHGRTLPEAIKCSTALVAISSAIEADLRQNELRAGVVKRIFNGIDLEHWLVGAFTKHHSRIELAIPEDRFVIMLPARICKQKRQDFALEAFATLRAFVPNSVLLLVGETYLEDQAYLDALLSQVAALGLEESVMITGFIEDMRRIYPVCDAVILCTQKEPFGRVILEAMAMGIPVIVPDASGPKEIVCDGTSGLLYDPSRKDALIKAICRVFAEVPLRESVIQGGLERVKDFGIAAHVSAVESLYSELLIENTL